LFFLVFNALHLIGGFVGKVQTKAAALKWDVTSRFSDNLSHTIPLPNFVEILQ